MFIKPSKQEAILVKFFLMINGYGYKKSEAKNPREIAYFLRKN